MHCLNTLCDLTLCLPEEILFIIRTHPEGKKLTLSKTCPPYPWEGSSPTSASPQDSDRPQCSKLRWLPRSFPYCVMIASILEHFFKMCIILSSLIISANPQLSSKVIVKTCKERGFRGIGDHWLALREWRCAVLQTVGRQRPIKRFLNNRSTTCKHASPVLVIDPKLLDCLHKGGLLSCSLVNHLIIMTCIKYGSNLMKAIRSKPPAGRGLPQQPT